MTKPTVYEKHNHHFAQVSGYVITDNKASRIATVAFKFPKNGDGRLYCYFHIIGMPMSQGYANGYGYDKKSAAVSDAIDKLKIADGCDPEVQKLMYVLKTQGKAMDSGNWDNVLRNAGYNLLQAI